MSQQIIIKQGCFDADVAAQINDNFTQLFDAPAGGSPAGDPTELQFNQDGASFGAVTGSSVSGPNVTLGGTLSLPSGELAAPPLTFTDFPASGFYIDLTEYAVYVGVALAIEGAQPPDQTATATTGADGSVTAGVHQIYQTFVTYTGETPPFLIATNTAPGAKAIDLSNLQAWNSTTIQSNIYMTAAGVTGATNSHLVGNPEVDTPDVFTIDIDDASLVSGDPPPTSNGTGQRVAIFQAGHSSGRLVMDLNDNGNVAIGTDTLYFADADLAIDNIAIGDSALNLITIGQDNIGIGQNSGSSIDEGSQNIGMGFDTNINIHAGVRNIAIGYSSGSTGDYSDTIALGDTVDVTGPNRAVIGNSDIGDVYFGTEVGYATLHATTAILKAVAVDDLPTCDAGSEGARASVNDSNAASMTLGYGTVVANGGTTHVPVYCDGSNWRIG